MTKAVQVALEALVAATDAWGQPEFPSVLVNEAIKQLRATLAQPEPEDDTEQRLHELCAEYERGRKAGIAQVYDSMLKAQIARPQVIPDSTTWIEP